MLLAENIRTQINLIDLNRQVNDAKSCIIECQVIFSKMSNESKEILNIDFDQIKDILEKTQLRIQSTRNFYKRLRYEG